MHDTSTTDKGRNDLSIGAVVLAAGSASRIGHRPKCLLQLNNEPLIQRQLRALSNAGITNIVVVLGHYADQIKPIVTQLPVTLVHNLTPDDGQNASLHCGLRALDLGKVSPSIDAVIVMLADQPLIDVQDIDDLLRAYRNRPAVTDVLVPTVNNLPGNPVVFNTTVRDAILSRDNTFGCKQWQIENSARVYRWSTANEHYRIDIDTLDDIETFQSRTGVSLQWPLDFS